ncbi:MAG: TIGR00374 family protein [Chloroflexi bacterium HGW-Chloroflexi-10]|nr:MAG: TIGR00374 family protein [Chloroflexi bacterium HGW-Chloroflexi-10]
MQTTTEQTYTAKTIFQKMLPGLALGFLVLLVMGFLGDLTAVLSAIRSFDWEIFPLVILFTLFNYTIRFLKWQFYQKQIGVKNFPWYQSARLFVAGFPLAVTPGKVGEVLKAVWLQQKTGVPVGRGVSIVVAERISDGLAVLLLSTLGVIAYPQYWPAFVIILGVLLAAIIISQIKPLAYWLLGLTRHIPLVKRFTGALTEFYEGSFTVFRPWPTLLSVGMGMVSWFGEGVGFYYILVALGLPAGKETLANAVFILAFSTVVGAVSALPGGLGAAEASIAGMLALVVKVSSTTASVATLLIRLATLWFGVGLGLLVWLFSLEYLGFIKKKE